MEQIEQDPFLRVDDIKLKFKESILHLEALMEKSLDDILDMKNEEDFANTKSQFKLKGLSETIRAEISLMLAYKDIYDLREIIK